MCDVIIIYNNKSTIMPGSGVSIFCISFCELVTVRKCQQTNRADSMDRQLR